MLVQPLYFLIPDLICFNLEGILCEVVTSTDLVLKAYEDKGFTKDEAIQQARVARILRKGEYNRKTKKVKLWQ